MQVIEKAMAGEPQHFEWQSLRRDGSLFDVEIALNRLEFGEHACLQAIVRDITSRKRIQEALRESEERFRLFMDNSPTIAWIKDEAGRHVYLSGANEQLFGVRMLDWRGKTDAELWPADVAEEFRRNDLTVLETDQAIQVIEHTPNEDGGYCYWLNTKFPFYDAGGRRYVAGIGMDITERKAAEAELARHRDHLEQMVAERTRELALAKDSAEAANRAKSIFLANMSHELRTPLNAILGFSDLLAHDNTIPEPQRQNIAIIHRAGSHLLSLINDVLEISRIESGRSSIQNQSFDFRAFLAALETMMQQAAHHKGLAFSIEESDALPRFVSGDANRLRQVLINLLGNAIKYTDNGQVSLRLTRAADRIRFEVVDTGCGIAQDQLTKIFQAFYQTESSVVRGEGTGLGLAFSREFVRMMGGRINVSSEPGIGSTFAFSILLPEADAPATAPGMRRVLAWQPINRASASWWPKTMPTVAG